MYKYALIKGDKIDYIGKAGLIILFASLSMFSTVASYKHGGDIINMAFAAVIYLEIITITVRGSRIKSCWKSIPMFSFTVFCIMECIRDFVLRPVFSSQLEDSETLFLIFIRTIMLMLCILISVKTAAVDDTLDCKHNDGTFIRLYLGILLTVQSFTFLAYIVRHDSAIQFIAGFFYKVFFCLAMLILSMPKHGVLNIRRIMLMLGMTAVITAFTYVMLRVLTSIFDGFDETNHDLIMISLTIAAETIIFCSDSKVRTELMTDVYDYSLSEKVLKSIG